MMELGGGGGRGGFWQPDPNPTMPSFKSQLVGGGALPGSQGALQAFHTFHSE